MGKQKPNPAAQAAAKRQSKAGGGEQAGSGDAPVKRHGFYSRYLHQGELQDLEALGDNGLEPEINLLRISMRRLLEQSADVEDIETGIRLLTVLGLSATRLASLLRTQSGLGGSRQDELYKTITEALAEVNKELIQP
jgi:hypothetical protein